MNLTGNTILITGGSSGIGLKLAEELLKRENEIIICGRSEEKLKKACQKLDKVVTYQCDISNQIERENLVGWINDHFPACNILINNAAIVHKTEFRSDPDIIEKAEYEIQTNFLGPLALSKLFLPILESNSTPSIINITTGLVYAPRAAYPIYNATKAALHSFSQVLRLQLIESPVRIRELLLPVVDTPWHKGDPPKIAISADEAVKMILSALPKKGR